jgi:hypothetical protein
MKKLRVAMLSLVALVAFSALVGTASAETTLLAEWLVSGVAVATLTSTEGNGALLLKDAKIGLEMECTGTLDGSVGANGEDEVTEILVSNLATSLSNHIVCKGIGGCSAPAEAAPEGLPWHTLLFLTEGGLFRDAVSKATYWSMCTVLGFLVEEECTVTNASYEVLNLAMPGGVEGMGEVSPLGTCTTGGTEAAQQSFVPGNVLKTLTGELSASE